MGLDLTSFSAALKQHYTNMTVQNMVYPDNPFFAMVAKMEEFGGRNLPIPLIYANPQSGSATFSRAQARSTSSATGTKAFLLTRGKEYSVATIDNDTILATKGNSNAFMEAATTEIDGAIYAATRSACQAMYRSGWGTLGQIGSISTTTITLLQVEDVVNFEVGMELDLAASESSGATRAYGTSTNGLIITAINRVTGVLTFGFNVTDVTNGIPTAAANDFIFRRGDRDAAAASILKLVGLEGWIPATAPTSTAFFGVDRTADVTRLGGLRYDGTSIPIEEALIDAATLVAREGGKPDTCFISYGKYGSLEKSLGSKVQYVNLNVGEIAFRGIQVNGPRGSIQVIPDQNCPANRAFMLTMKTWKLYSLGKAIQLFDTDGQQMLRQSAADGVEVRVTGYLNLGCSAPGWNCNVQL